MPDARDLWLSLLLAAIGCAVYANAVVHPFVHDDIVFIVQNPSIGRVDDMANVFLHHTPSAIAGANAYYRPILEVIYRLEYRLFGLNPHAYHAMNVLLHAINGVLVFFLLSRLRLARGMAWVVAALFLLHPVQSESVACVAGISNIAAAFFVLVCLNCYVRGRPLWALAAFILALFTKESTLVLPLCVMAVDGFMNPGPWRRRLARAAPFLTAAFLFLLFRQHLTGANLSAAIFASRGELYLRVLAIPRTLLTYLKILIWPNDLHYYRNTDILASSTLAFLLCGILLAAAVWFFQRLDQGRTKNVLLGLAWFFIFLLPMLNVLPLVNEYSFIMTAEHFLYLPMLGLMMAAVVIASQWGMGPLTQRCVIALILGICAVITVGQNRFWRNEVALFERMARYEPRFGRGHLLLAKAYYANHQEGLAQEHYLKALRIMQDYEGKAKTATSRRFYQGYIQEILADLTKLDKTPKL